MVLIYFCRPPDGYSDEALTEIGHGQRKNRSLKKLEKLGRLMRVKLVIATFGE